MAGPGVKGANPGEGLASLGFGASRLKEGKEARTLDLEFDLGRRRDREVAAQEFSPWGRVNQRETSSL